MGNAELNAYPEAISDLGDTVGSKAKAYIEKIDEITGLVNGLADYWGGETYDTFKSGYETHLVELQELNSTLAEIAGELGTTADEATTLISNINTSVE